MKKKNIEEFLEILTVIVHAQPVFRNDKFKDRSSDDTYRILPGYTCFLEWNCFQDLSSDVLPFPSPPTFPPVFPAKLARYTVLRATDLTGALPLKRWYVARPSTRFLLYSIPRVFIARSFADFDGSETSSSFVDDIYYSCERKILLQSFLSNRFLWNRIQPAWFMMLNRDTFFV